MPVQPFAPFAVNLGSLAAQQPASASTRLQLSPTLTDTWQVEALLFNITTRYSIRYTCTYAPVYEKYALLLAHLENKITALIGQRGQAEKAVTASEAGEVGLPAGKELDNQQVQTWQARATVSQLNAEIETVTGEKTEVEKQRVEWGLADGFAAIEAPTLDMLMGVKRAGETVFIDHLQSTRVLSLLEWRTAIGSEHQFDHIEVEGQVIETAVGRISFPIPVVVGPGETLTASLTVNILNPGRGGTVEPINRGVTIGKSNVPEPGELVPTVHVTELAAAYTEEPNPKGNQ